MKDSDYTLYKKNKQMFEKKELNFQKMKCNNTKKANLLNSNIEFMLEN